MLECLKKINKEKTGLFAAGVLFGTAGIKILTSKDAKKFYSPNTIGTPNSSATGTSNNADFLIM